MLDGLWCILVKIINFFTQGLFQWWIEMMIWVLELLPSSPFKFEPLQWGAFGDALGYFIPFDLMLADLARLLLAVTLWYAIQHITRILRIIR